jgi:DNA-binding GntR family transcriptional regulator
MHGKSEDRQDMAIHSPVGRHQVREEIQRRILSGESQPGERLTQQSLAKELGVAQGTVRESLLELQWLGLVESIDRLGVFVGKLDAARLCEAYQVREFLEGLAARLACDHGSRADVALLRNMAHHIWNLSQENKEEEMGAADRAFHLQIMNLSHNKVLLRLAEGYRVLGMAVRASRDPRTVYDEHLRIVDAIDHNFPDEAEKIMRLHVAEARRMIEQQAAKNQFTPKWVADPK